MTKTVNKKSWSSDINLDDPAIRRAIIKRGGLMGWCMVYLKHYFTVTPAKFHYLLTLVLESELPEDELLEIIGFRGSAKSTFAVLALPLYLSLEKLRQFIIVAGDTTAQTKLNIENIRYELESNEYIREDYGLVFSDSRNWSVDKLLLASGTLIMGRSRGQKMRGLRHRQYRPQVVIVDDAEDLEWVKKKDNRDKTERWFNSEVVPAQQEDKSKLVLIGNLLHKDALMMRVKKSKKEDGTPLFKCLEFPLIDRETKEVTWAGKYPSKEAVQKQREKVRSRVTWSREYLLKIVSEEDQVIKEEDIHKYPNHLPDKRNQDGALKHKVIDGGVGEDLAISEKQTADYTAMVAATKVKIEGRTHILIKPNPVNKRMGFDASLKEAAKVNATMPYGTKWYVEDVGFQRAAIQKMQREGLSVYPMRPVTDKKARLESVSPFIIDGTVMFPESGCEDLIEQLVGFGSEEHDDLVDAIVYLIMGFAKRRSFKKMERPDKI